MESHKILYKCKLCGREGVALADKDCPPEWIDKLVPALCCNQCFDARESRMAAESFIFKACHLLINARQFKDPDAVRKGAIKMLEDSVPVFASAVCSGNRLQTIMEAEFIDNFVRKPEKAGPIMGFYKHKVEEIARGNQAADAL